MTAALPSPEASESPFSRALALWRSQGHDAPFPEIGDRPLGSDEPERSILAYAPYALALVLVLGVGATAASLATAPALTDSIETVTAIDARSMGLAANLDPTGQQKKSATLSRDVGSLKSEISRLQKALDQAKSNQSALSKQAAGQAALSQDEVRTLKTEISGLQRSLGSAHEEAAKKIDELAAKVDRPSEDAARVAELQQRIDRMEREAAEKTRAAAAAPRDPGPETTAALGDRNRRDGASIVRNWAVRDVVRGVALLEGRHGMVEVVRGARAPGMGRVRSIERREGQWVVVTDRGLVLERSEL